MPLESLLKLAETLKTRVSVHGAELGANEIRTRYALIDPLLRELGWDTSDPSAVIPEYKTRQGGIADYALMSAGKPAVMVEAKKLGTPLRDDGLLSQILGCCTMEGVKRFAVTDGAKWEIYETNKSGSIDQNPVTQFDISKDSPSSVCLKALALWRPSVEADPPSCIQCDWHPLKSIKEVANRSPSEMLLPGNTRTELGSWVKLSLETVRWLSRNGHLTQMDSPIKFSPQSKRYILNTKPIHSDGKRFKQPREVNGFWVEGDTGAGGRGHIKNMITVIEHVGQDPSKFRVRFA